MRAAYAALGGDPEHLEMLTMQLVHLVRRGERAQMSKRSGEFVTLEDLVSEVGVDAARWFLLSRSHDTTIDLDLDLAREQSNENPVYYVQYAHARIVSVLAKAGPERVGAGGAPLRGSRGRRPRAPRRSRRGHDDELEGLHPAERALIKRLLAFPSEIVRGGRNGARPTGSRPTRSSWPRTSRPSTATAASCDAGARPERRIAAAGAVASPRSARSRAAWICSGSARPWRCEARVGRARVGGGRVAGAARAASNVHRSPR